VSCKSLGYEHCLLRLMRASRFEENYCLSGRLDRCQRRLDPVISTARNDSAYLSESLAFPAAVDVFFRFGVGILHSIEKATQLVHGTPKLAASHRTYVLSTTHPVLISNANIAKIAMQ
jgi:hypothetical protein